MNLGTSDHDNKMTSSGSLDVLDVVGIVLVTLKIIGVEPVVGWSWWIVLSPLWIYIGVLVIVVLVAKCIVKKN